MIQGVIRYQQAHRDKVIELDGPSVSQPLAVVAELSCYLCGSRLLLIFRYRLPGSRVMRPVLELIPTQPLGH